MKNQEQAYLNGFIKRAASYGVDKDTAFQILKRANDGPKLMGGEGTLIGGGGSASMAPSRSASLNSTPPNPSPAAAPAAGNAAPALTTGLKGSGTGMMSPGNGFEQGFKNIMEKFRPAPKPISGGGSFESAPIAPNPINGNGTIGRYGSASMAPKPISGGGSLDPGTYSNTSFSPKPGATAPIDTTGKLTLTPNNPNLMGSAGTGSLIQGGSGGFGNNQGNTPPAPKPVQSAAGMNEGLASHMHLNELPAQPAAPAQQPQAQQPAAQPNAGPSDAFLKKIMGSYDPNSKVDRAQADKVRQLYAQGKTTAKDIYGSPDYQINREALGARKGANRSAYSGLKSAPGIPR